MGGPPSMGEGRLPGRCRPRRDYPGLIDRSGCGKSRRRGAATSRDPMPEGPGPARGKIAKVRGSATRRAAEKRSYPGARATARRGGCSGGTTWVRFAGGDGPVARGEPRAWEAGGRRGSAGRGFVRRGGPGFDRGRAGGFVSSGGAGTGGAGAGAGRGRVQVGGCGDGGFVRDRSIRGRRAARAGGLGRDRDGDWVRFAGWRGGDAGRRGSRPGVVAAARFAARIGFVLAVGAGGVQAVGRRAGDDRPGDREADRSPRPPVADPPSAPSRAGLRHHFRSRHPGGADPPDPAGET